VDSVWLVVVPWVAFGAVLTSFFVWLRWSPRRSSPPQPPQVPPKPGRPDREQEGDPGRHKTTLP
jgi:hypothetical protein